VLTKIAGWCKLRDSREVQTWWLVDENERYVVMAIEQKIGRFRSVRPDEVYVRCEDDGTDRHRQAVDIENMREHEFASMIGGGAVRRLI
jgi:hypothetical protein